MSVDFAPPPRALSQWRPGMQVDRLLDDVSDIWAGAVVRACHPGDLYDIVYLEDDILERDVEGDELRRRYVECDLPEEVWIRLGHYFDEPLTLCALESVAQQPGIAASQAAPAWWSAAYHHRFGRCGDACGFAKGAPACRMRIGLQPWKERYRDRAAPLREERAIGSPSAASGPQDMMYMKVHGRSSESNSRKLDGRLRFGADAGKETYYDPRHGCQVSYDG